MNKIIKTAFLAMALMPYTLQAQSLKDLFLHMPMEVCPALTEYNRLELVDNQKNGKEMRTRNAFQTYSTMQSLTDDYAHLSVSDSSEKVIKLLTKTDSIPIIMIISTVFCDSIPDSSVSFYSTEWQPLDATAYISEPTSEEFRYIVLNPENDTLTITISNPLALQTNGSDKPAEQTSVSHTLQWNGTSFLKQNDKEQ
ncbi:MAG: DUF3256 family protein [Prevotellaceae bacterium]|nr:DUF3256 family protein [Prevotellaceae bacterium]